MARVMFDTDSYEQDLAMMMLEVLMKRNEISLSTYKAAKRSLMTREEEYGKSSVSGTAQAAG